MPGIKPGMTIEMLRSTGPGVAALARDDTKLIART
jgi:hypothetical protein